MLAAAVFGFGSAFANHDPEVIHACASNQNGGLRVVDSASGCRNNERAVEWSTESAIPIPQACPPGQFVTGITGTGQLICSALDTPGATTTTVYPSHSNGLGQTYIDCRPLGVPGDPSTYNAEMAEKARAAWSPEPTALQSAICGSGSAVVKQTATSAATWVWSGPLAGFVVLNTSSNQPLCPGPGDPTWN